MNAMRDRIALEGCGAWEGENIVSIDFWFFEEKKREINKKKTLDEIVFGLASKIFKAR